MEPIKPPTKGKPKIRISPEGLTGGQYGWITRVVDGLGFVEALGSRRKSRRPLEALAAKYLATPEVQRALVERLMLSGQADRAREVLGYIATLQALTGLKDADSKAASALMPTGKPGKRQLPAASPTDASPVARSVAALSPGKPDENL